MLNVVEAGAIRQFNNDSNRDALYTKPRLKPGILYGGESGIPAPPMLATTSGSGSHFLRSPGSSPKCHWHSLGYPSNPTQQQKHPVCTGYFCWRREWDSNPRYRYRYTTFRVWRVRPLCHLSTGRKRSDCWFIAPKQYCFFARLSKTPGPGR